MRKNGKQKTRKNEKRTKIKKEEYGQKNKKGEA